MIVPEAMKRLGNLVAPQTRKADYLKEWYKKHPNAYKRQLGINRRRRNDERIRVIELLGGMCTKCKETDYRILQVHHVNGNGKRDYERFGGPGAFYRAILKGNRSTKGLSVLCPNCNIIHEYEIGKRNALSSSTSPHSAVIRLLGGKCVKCGSNDIRVLQINHLNGGGKTEYSARYGKDPETFYRNIMRKERSTSDLNVLCANCNWAYRYEQNREKELNNG